MPILKFNSTKCNGWRKYEKDYSAFISKIQELLAHLDSKKSMAFKPVVLVIVILLLFLAIPISFAGNYERTLDLKAQYGLVKRDFHFSIPFSLYEYYNGKTFEIDDHNDYSKFVTPDAVKPIADNLRNLTLDSSRSDQEFANAVLSLVHQIPYAHCEIKYPVETLVDNFGKCDTLSLLAASIMKAGGLDVVLLYFKGVHHVNVGVHLPYEPHTSWWWLPATGFELYGKTYWVAECTPAMDWKVGDLPPLLEEEQPWIITLENSEKTSPGQISSKCCGSLQSSSISINLSSEFTELSYQAPALKVSGSLSPACPNEIVTVYFSQDGISYKSGKTATDILGNYYFSLNLTSTGTHYVRTSWSGNENYAGADSEMLTIFMGFPQSLFNFTTPGYHFTYLTNPGFNEIRDRQGVRDFFDIKLSGTGIVLTGEFIILRDKHNFSSQMQEKTIPETLQEVQIWNRLRSIIQVPERTIAELVNIPKGMNPRRLPDDFEKTMNNNFGFVMRSSTGDNYSVCIKGMNAYDVAQINQFNGNGTVLMDASEFIRDNIWYKTRVVMAENETTIALYYVNGTLLEKTQILLDDANVSDLVVLIADNTEKAVAFKKLTVSTLAEPAQILIDEVGEKINEKELVLLKVAIILIITAFAAIVHKKTKILSKKRKLCGRNLYYPLK
jgi:hypothetical protein